MAAAPAACCTCASVLGAGAARIDDKTEKPLRDLSLSCCGRIICAKCIDSNPRLATYCPFCQKTRLDRLPSSGEASALLPPPYTVDDPDPTSVDASTSESAPLPNPPLASAESSQPSPPVHPPPSYSNAVSPRPGSQNPSSVPSTSASARADAGAGAQNATGRSTNGTEGDGEAEADVGAEVTHFLAPHDSMASLALSYGVPVAVLRSHNKLHADHLLSARRRIGVPRSHYRGASLSPHPVEGAEESERKARLRRFMMRCKCADYKVATLYLEEHTWDLDAAVDRWWGDERWEREHPLPKQKVAMKP